MKSKFFASPLFNVLAFSFFWAIQIFVSKLAFLAGAKVIPFTVQSAVFVIIILTIFVLPRKINEVKGLSRNVFLWLLLANVIHYGIGGILSNGGTSLTTAINAGFLVQFTTVTTTTLAWLILKEKITASKIITVVLIIIGSFFLITKGQLIIPHVGDILILLACLSWSTGGVLVRKVLKSTNVSGDVVSFLRPIAGLPVMLFFISLSSIYPSPVRETFQQNLFNFQYILYAALNGLFVALLWIFLNRTLKIASASYMTMMSSLTPVIVAVLAIILLKESLSPIQLVGVLIIISSGIVTQLLKIDMH